jgi:hypothetical protein
VSIVTYNTHRPSINDLAGIKLTIAMRLTRIIFATYEEALGHIFVEWRIDRDCPVVNIKHGATIYPFIVDDTLETRLDEFVDKIWSMDASA